MTVFLYECDTPDVSCISIGKILNLDGIVYRHVMAAV